MITRLLSHFPPHAHPLTLSSDPDGLLSGEGVLVELTARGFQVIREDDPVVLRYQVEQARPFNAQKPVLIITTGPLEALPFDLWQAARRVALSLHEFFPNLAYPVLRTLSPAHLEKLMDQCPPADRLGRQGTIDYLLQKVFELSTEDLGQPHALIGWLVRLHDQLFPLPPLLQERLLELLKKYPLYAAWNLTELLRSRESLADFIQREWSGYIRQSPEHNFREGEALFSDESMQNMLPELVWRGVVNPEKVDEEMEVPAWAKVGVETKVVSEDDRQETIRQLLSGLANEFGDFSAPSRWEHWQQIAAQWAELNSLWFSQERPAGDEMTKIFKELAERIDQAFMKWLPVHYSALGTQRLPVPKQVHHIPHYLADLKERGKIQRAALIVLDGMSLCDWRVIGSVWEDRHPGWNMLETLLLAQVPTITTISRRSLVSGLPPSGFAADLDGMPTEKSLWHGFWSRAGLPTDAFFYATISLDRQDYPPEVDSTRLTALCLVDDTPDKLAHSAYLGAANQQAALRLWLMQGQENNSLPLETLIDQLLLRDFAVFIASDHGHVEAQGYGTPSEGILAQSRGRRARLYRDTLAAQRAQVQFPETIIWGDLLPPGIITLMPAGRMAFTTSGETVVTHGGISLDELIVPLVTISRI